MSKHECPVVRVEIEPHPNADAIELAKVGGYVSIVKKGQFKSGDLAIYIPEQSVLPDWMLKLMGFWDDLNGKGTLSGSAGNRVRAIKLRGVLSQGLLFPFAVDAHDAEHISYFLPAQGEHPELGVDYDRVEVTPTEGADFAEHLQITKFEPQVPQAMAGKVAGGDLDASIAYDFENLKKVPSLFEDGMEVQITEKLHGTFVQVGLIPQALWEGKSWADKMADVQVGERIYKAVVTSKGQGAKGLLLDTADTVNIYVRIARELRLWERVATMMLCYGVPHDKPVFLCGEIFGQGVQDLGYGQAQPTFRAFDFYVGTRSDGFFIDPLAFKVCCNAAQVDMVPVLYTGPFSLDVVRAYTDGNTTIAAAGKQIREGVVVKAMFAPKHPRYGRRIAKSVSEAYLLRKGNVTEFQ